MAAAAFAFVLTLACFAAAAGSALQSTKEDCQTFTCSDIDDSMPVCGDDNQTYKNKCQILKLQCEGMSIAIKHNGRCKDVPPCLVSRRYAQKKLNSFIPKCREDGSYAPMQCKENFTCWCVTPQGDPVPNTTVTNGRPNCKKKEKSNTRRRSSFRRQRNKEGCTGDDRSQFNLGLTLVFTKEYDRANLSITAVSREKDFTVIEWKFNQTDKNRNDMLEKKEYSQLKRIIRKVVKPKRCAKTFIRLCDLDHDETITRQEWINCITDDTHNYEGGARVPGNNGGHNTNDDIMLEERDDDDDDEDSLTGVLQGRLTKITGQIPGYNDDSLDRNKDENDSNDCFSDRKSALDNQKNGDNALYVPECMPDGRYKRMQCYKNTGYCWCVNEDTGKNIPGTSLKDNYPNCDLLPTPNRPMKGCQDQRKFAFLRDLMEYLNNLMIAETNGTGIVGWQTSREEKLATWSFVMLDENQSKHLERKEWKTFRSLVMDHHLLRRCGKKLPKYCDINHDRKISLAEWLNCLNVQRGLANIETTTHKPSMFSKRKGPNPLESYLKGD